MVIRWIFAAVCVVLGKLLVYALAPVFALPLLVRFAEENETTGYPSQFPGKLRAFLIKPLMWAQTHDDCLDAYWTAKRYGKWIDKYTQEYFDTHWWLRYYCYVMWLWRNNSYGLAHSLGFYNKNIHVIKTRGDFLWNTGINHWSYEVVQNSRGQRAFEFKTQLHYTKKYYFEARLGYGLRRESPKNLGMVYVRIIPFRR